jgi:uncharacterized glyoxalase superfamily protein PhnB
MSARCVPMIHVPDVGATVEWYRSVGFDVVQTYGEGGEALSFAVLSFGGSQIMFNAGGPASSQERRDIDLYAYTEHVDAMYERLKSRVNVVESPHDTFYGMREVTIRDVNGFWVTFGETSAGALLMRGVAEADADMVSRALDRGGLSPERLGAALALAAASGRSAAIIMMLEEAGAVPPPQVAPETLQRYVGDYVGNDGHSARVVWQDGGLRVFSDESPGVNLLPLDRTVFKALELEDATVTFDVEGDRAKGLTLRYGSHEQYLARSN